MSETLTRTPQDPFYENADKLREAEYGYALREVFEAACVLDPRLENVEIIPIADDEPGLARALPAWRTETGKHQVLLGLNNVDVSLQKMTASLDKIPGARELFSEKVGIEPFQLTPEVMHAFALAHELGHISEFMDFEANPKVLETKNRIEKDALPIGRVTVSAIMHEGSPVRAAVLKNWNEISTQVGVGTMDDLLEKQHTAYRGMTSERLADDFASDVLAQKPTVVDQLTSPNRAAHRNLPTNIYG